MKTKRGMLRSIGVVVIALSSVAAMTRAADAAGTGGRGVSHDRRGEEAVRALGARTAVHAREMGLSQADLRRTVREDHTLRVNQQGDIAVVDPAPPSGALSGASAASWPSSPALGTATTFTLHSHAASTRKIYLDFNGHTTKDTTWNTSYTLPTITSAPYDTDGKPTTFSAGEHAAIQNVFLSVREDFSMFDVDVTTEDPGVEALRKSSASDTAYGIRVVISPTDWLCTPILQSPCGGIAYVGSFDWADGAPTFVHNARAKDVAEAVSHEVGHTLGLTHDGLTAGDAGCAADLKKAKPLGVCGYYYGHGDWAPIMGVGYSKRITQWSKGEYANANNQQDDIAVIKANGISELIADIGDTAATAYPLPLGYKVSASRISFTGDVDVFKVTVPSTPRGRATITGKVTNWYGTTVDTNLNARIRLRNAAGTLLATASPTDTTSATLTAELATGTYFMFVDGVGEGSASSTGYSGYGSLGRYNFQLS
jgi:hypothetical protein